MPVVQIGGKQHEVQRFSFTKGLRAVTLLNIIQKLVPELSTEIASFVRSYRSEHFESLDRVQARMRYGGEMPVIGDDGRPMVHEGRAVTMPAPFESLTVADWERAGHVFTRPEDPPLAAVVAAVFPVAAERAEAPLLRLLAICLIDNESFQRYVDDDVWQDKADEVAKTVLGPAYIEEVMELGATVAELLEGQVLAKVEDIRERSGKLMSRLRPKGTQGRPDSQTSSGTAGDKSSDGSASSPTATSGTPGPSEGYPGTSSSDSETSGSGSARPLSSTAPASGG